jgi:tetratricopeptide (TPR) repeat protein
MEQWLLLQVLDREEGRQREFAKAQAALAKKRRAESSSVLCKKGDRLVGEGELAKAFAVYRRNLAIRNEKWMENSRNIEAQREMGRAMDRMGGLARKFLLAGEFRRALACTEEVLNYSPDTMVFDIIRAHALMFLNGQDEARQIYRKCRGQTLPRGKPCERAIVHDFARLRNAGHVHPLMKEIDQLFATGKETRQTADIIAEAESQSIPAQVVAPQLADLTAGDELRALGKFHEALAAYRRGLAIAKPKAEANSSDVQAQKDCRNLVIRIGEVAFDLLRPVHSRPRAWPSRRRFPVGQNACGCA